MNPSLAIVVDTNVWVSALIWGGPSAQVIDAVVKGQLKIICCPQILSEIDSVLEYDRLAKVYQKAGKSKYELLTHILNIAEFYPDPVDNRCWVTEDPDDDIFIRLALQEHASCIVSGDRHLRKLKTIQGIPIYTPTDFLNSI